MKNKSNPTIGPSLVSDIADTAVKLTRLINAYIQIGGTNEWLSDCHDDAFEIAVAAIYEKITLAQGPEREDGSDDRLEKVYGILAGEGLSRMKNA